jgi:Tfp pilus assembly protein PilO
VSERGMVRLTYEKWEELEALRQENEELRAAAEQRAEDAVWENKVHRLLRGQGQLREKITRLEAELADARRMHGGGNPAP